MSDKIKKNILISILISIVIYLALAFYGNFDLVLSTFNSFNWEYFPFILLLIYITFFLKFLKWQYYLKLLKVEIKFSDSFKIFMSALTMSVTPGKIGELIKPYMVKDINGTPISKTIPIIFAERITEFFALLFLIMLGIDLLNSGILIPIIILLILIIFLLVIFNKAINDWLILKLNKISLLQKYIEPFRISLTHSRLALKPKSFLLMVLLSLIIWIIEGLGFYLILINLNTDLSFVNSLFTYLFSIFVGSVSMLPAGLGVTDGSLTFMLTQNNISKDIAVAATLLMRIATLWFALFIGIISMMWLNKKSNEQ